MRWAPEMNVDEQTGGEVVGLQVGVHREGDVCLLGKSSDARQKGPGLVLAKRHNSRTQPPSHNRFRTATMYDCTLRRC
jgi:hypothetical protein